jgi:hypothetical protein
LRTMRTACPNSARPISFCKYDVTPSL